MQSVIFSTRIAWNELEFQKLQNELGETASVIASAQEVGRLSRKKLVESFLRFRNNASEEAKKAAASVLKSFQAEVDSLTSRSQKAEDAFIQVYQRLAEMPDPSLALAEVETITKQAQRASDLNTENSRLRETIGELKAEILVSKSNETQLRKTEARIEELEEECAQSQRRLEKAIEEQEHQAALHIAEANAQTQEVELKAASLAESLKAAQSQIFDLQSRLEQVRSARTQEVEILVSDLEKAQEQIVVLQQKNQLSECQHGNDQSAILTSNPTETLQLLTQLEELESQLESKKKEAADLMTHLNAVEIERKEESANLHSRLESTEASLRSAQQSLSALQSELQLKSDYDAIKWELEVLRSIEFDQQSDENPLSDEALEIRLRRKNEKLQNRLASVNAEKDRIETECNTLRSANADLAEREAQQKVLIIRLEEDLNRASAWQKSHHQLLHENSDVGGEQDAEPNSPLREILFDQKEENAAAEESSILSIVQNQRDRLRQQNRELEENLLAMRQQVVAIQTQLEALRQDNVQLYEKIRFVQSYNSSPNAGQNCAQENEVLARYSNAYEARLNPFKQFGHLERQKRYQALQAHEKIMHSLGRMIVHNRGVRLATFAYVLIMHLLVFLVLYKMVTTGPICPSSGDNPPNL
nr:cut homeobox 1b [Hymenolepis microstoma]